MIVGVSVGGSRSFQMIVVVVCSSHVCCGSLWSVIVLDI